MRGLEAAESARLFVCTTKSMCVIRGVWGARVVLWVVSGAAVDLGVLSTFSGVSGAGKMARQDVPRTFLVVGGARSWRNKSGSSVCEGAPYGRQH